METFWAMFKNIKSFFILPNQVICLNDEFDLNILAKNSPQTTSTNLYIMKWPNQNDFKFQC
jgi:hypothetical protein